MNHGNQRDESLIIRTQNSLDRLNHFLKKINYVRDELENLLQDYTQYPSPEIDTEIKLRAMNSLFESYYLQQILRIEQSEKPPSDVNAKQILHLYLSGKWLGYEMGQILYAVNNIFQVFAVQDVAIARSRIGKNDAVRITHDVYQNAKLFFFLHPDEQLQLRKLVFSSPGELELLSQMIALTPALANTALFIYLAKKAKGLIRDLPDIYENWIRKYYNTKDIKRKEQRSRILHTLFIDKLNSEINKRYTDSEIPIVKKAFDELRTANDKIVDANLADPINLGWREIRAIIAIERMLSDGKVDFDYNPKEDEEEI